MDKSAKKQFFNRPDLNAIFLHLETFHHQKNDSHSINQQDFSLFGNGVSVWIIQPLCLQPSAPAQASGQCLNAKQVKER